MPFHDAELERPAAYLAIVLPYVLERHTLLVFSHVLPGIEF